MTKWELVPAGKFADLMFHLEQLESNGALPYQLEGMAAAIEAAPQPPKLSDERIYQVWGEQAEKTIGKSHSEFLVSFVRAIEREILGGGHE